MAGFGTYQPAKLQFSDGGAKWGNRSQVRGHRFAGAARTVSE
jgi:hypothetical protein